MVFGEYALEWTHRYPSLGTGPRQPGLAERAVLLTDDVNRLTGADVHAGSEVDDIVRLDGLLDIAADGDMVIDGVEVLACVDVLAGREVDDIVGLNALQDIAVDLQGMGRGAQQGDNEQGGN